MVGKRVVPSRVLCIVVVNVWDDAVLEYVRSRVGSDFVWMSHHMESIITVIK